MALIPGTLPSDTCYGTPQDLLELFAQYLDVPAFALNSKVVFSTVSTGLTADVVWFDIGSGAPASATNPIMKITVSGAFVDYVKNYIINAPVVTIVGADTLLILDATDGNTKRGLVSDIVPVAGSITPAQLSQPFTRATAVASTSGTAIDFTSIPSWAKRITVMFNEVSTSGTSSLLLQMGTSSGILNTGYVGMAGLSASTGANTNTGITAGIPLGFSTMSAAVTNSGSLQITNLSANIWTVNGSLAALGLLYLVTSAGVKNLGATLDRIRITTVNGSDTFDGGSINIMYEG